MATRKFPPFQEWLGELEAQAQQMGVSMDSLPRAPQQIYVLEQNGFVVDMETGDIVAMDTDRVALTVIGEATVVANEAWEGG